MSNAIPTPIFSFDGNNNVLKFLFMDLSALGLLEFQDKAERLPYNDEYDTFIDELEKHFGLINYQTEWYKSHSNVSVQFRVMYKDYKGPGYCPHLHNEAISFIAGYFNDSKCVLTTRYKSGNDFYSDRD